MSITLFLAIFAPIILIAAICRLCMTKTCGNKRNRFGTIQERMKKKLFFGYAELIQTMSNEDLKILQQTYENTIKNAQTIKIKSEKKVTNISKKLKKVFFADENDSNQIVQTEQSHLI